MNKHKRIAVVGSLPESLVNFRGPLLQAMAGAGHRVVACAPEAPPAVVAALQGMGVEYRNFPLCRTGINPLRDLNTLLALVGIFRNVKPDIVLSYTIKPVIFGSLAARLAKVENVYAMITGLGYAFTGRDRRRAIVGAIAQALYKLSLRYNRKVFFQNPDDHGVFRRLGLIRDPGQGVIVNGSGVDTDHFHPRPLPTKPSFLLIARLLREKGVVEYIEAARVIRQTFPDVDFSLVGWLDENPGALKKEDLRRWVAEGVVDYLGRLEDVRPAIARASIYVLPSYAEGTPRSVLEAMAMGRPVITTDAAGCRETVRNGQNGFLVPVRDVKALVEAMRAFIENPELIARMGGESRRLALEKYDVRKVNAKILQTMELST